VAHLHIRALRCRTQSPTHTGRRWIQQEHRSPSISTRSSSQTTTVPASRCPAGVSFLTPLQRSRHSVCLTPLRLTFVCITESCSLSSSWITTVHHCGVCFCCCFSADFALHNGAHKALAHVLRCALCGNKKDSSWIALVTLKHTNTHTHTHTHTLLRSVWLADVQVLVISTTASGARRGLSHSPHVALVSLQSTSF
jgi:hypothetical protein